MAIQLPVKFGEDTYEHEGDKIPRWMPPDGTITVAASWLGKDPATVDGIALTVRSGDIRAWVAALQARELSRLSDLVKAGEGDAVLETAEAGLADYTVDVEVRRRDAYLELSFTDGSAAFTFRVRAEETRSLSMYLDDLSTLWLKRFEIG
jgi:hypothetical protein